MWQWVATGNCPTPVNRRKQRFTNYLNLQRFQCSIQNVDLVDRERSDAHLHTHAYATAIALMGIPLFFLETKHYSAAAKDEIRALLTAYKAHRASLFQGIVHPIGAKPDNASWTGFQCHLPDENRGYLLIFRERCAAGEQHAFGLGWLRPGKLGFSDLLTTKSWQQSIASDGSTAFSINHAPGFLFLQYSDH